MFSTTTIASSTTRPIASTSASIVRMLSEKPSVVSRMNEAISEIGTVTAGISVARRLPRNRKITAITIRPASTRVWITALSEASMNSE